MELTSFPLTPVRWAKACRVLPARFPPTRIFERLTGNPESADLLTEIERLTDPRVRQEMGAISIVPEGERVTGPGASRAMAPFIHINPNGSRFSDGRFGVCYVADRLGTAVQESCYHLGQFYAAASDPPHDEDMQVMAGTISGNFRKLAAGQADDLDPDKYSVSRQLGEAVYLAGEDGILFPSVRNQGHPAIAAMRPRTMGIPARERYLRFHWDGSSISRIFDYQWEKWAERDVFL